MFSNNKVDFNNLDFNSLANRYFHDYNGMFWMTEGKFSSDEDLSHLLNMVENYPQVTGLNLSLNLISTAGIKMLAERLTKNCPQITSLVLTENNIDDDGIEALASIPNLSQLDVSNNKITEKGAKFLSNKNNLISLKINCNQLGCKVVSDIIANNPLLSELEIAGTFFYKKNDDGTYVNAECEKEVDVFNEACKKNHNINSLNIGGNFMLKGNIKSLLPLKLTKLKADYIQLNDEDMKVLSEITSLNSLNISSNNIGDEGMKSVINLTSLKSLNVMCNQIKSEGTEAIAQLPKLKKLVISYNKIGQKEAVALIQNKTITSLKAWYCGIKPVKVNGINLKAALEKRMFGNESRDFGLIKDPLTFMKFFNQSDSTQSSAECPSGKPACLARH